MTDDLPASHGPRQSPLDDHALFRKIVHRSALLDAWSKVWANGGAAGGDRISLDHYARDLNRRIAKLQDDLQSGRYHPGPVRMVDIPKRDGKGIRHFSIPCVNDRIIQTSAANILTPLLDEEFEPDSFGYRKGKSIQQAASQIALAHHAGHGWIVDADIKSYFDRIPHNHLMERWEQSVSPGPLTELVWSWITSAAPSGRGVAQGSPISPLLANLFLDRLDEAFSQDGARIIRFADDFVILCHSEKDANQALEKVRRLLARQGLALNEEKTSVRDFERGFSFLGHLFVKSLVMKQQRVQGDEKITQQWMRQIAKDDQTLERELERQTLEDAAKEARGYSPGFRILYVLEKDRRLSIRNQAFAVEECHVADGDGVRWKELIAIPHQDIDRIDLGPGVDLTDAARQHALATETPIAFVNGHGETQGWLTPDIAPRAKRHMAQAGLILDDNKRVALARSIVSARMRNQRAVLRRLLTSRAHPPAPVSAALITLNKMIARPGKGPLAKASSIPELMGCEGAATAAWWRAISSLLPVEMAFDKRDRPANDRADICFNFLSWMLERDVSVAVMRAGLHPGFGVLHSTDDLREACVYDLMEEFRAHLIGGLTVYCTNRNIITRDLFRDHEGGYRLTREGSRALIRAYESRVSGRVKSPRTGRKVTWRQLMIEQAFALAAHYEGHSDYQPYVMDY